jgi:hypothetical protein
VRIHLSGIVFAWPARTLYDRRFGSTGFYLWSIPPCLIIYKEGKYPDYRTPVIGLKNKKYGYQPAHLDV